MINLAKVQTPTLNLRRASERGGADHGWLKTAFSFSFADYHDPEHMQFSNLRVINDDWIAAGKGFGMHPHRNAEIFSYVLEGALEHKDSMGNGSVVAAGGVQYMSAGAGVRHSEFNPSASEPVRLLQVWLLPDTGGGAPRYETLDISAADKDGALKLFLSKQGREGSMVIKSDADIYAATLDGEQGIDFTVNKGRCAWIQIARGTLVVNGQVLGHGDGLSASGEGRLDISAGKNAEFLLFDLPASA